MSYRVALAHQRLDAAALLADFTAQAEGTGAIVSFTGLARSTTRDGAAVSSLLLESYGVVTIGSMEAIMADAAQRFAITHGLVVHRDGEIAPGEAIVFVAAASAHRRAAFEAADYLMDRLKTEAVFWKREDGPGGSRWIEPTTADQHDAARWRITQDS